MDSDLKNLHATCLDGGSREPMIAAGVVAELVRQVQWLRDRCARLERKVVDGQ